MLMSRKADSFKTQTIKIDRQQLGDNQFIPAVELLRSGEVVGFPTETVYGLGGLITRPEAIGKIFEAKNRPPDNPLIVHISDFQMLDELVLELPRGAEKLCRKFWPGPLTVLFKKSPLVPEIVTAGLSTVAVRMPSHQVARKLIELAGAPVAAPSANLSGRPSPTTAEHVYHDLKGKIPLIIDGGKSELGVESTVIDLDRDPPVLLRPGGLNYEELQQLIPQLELVERGSKNDDNLPGELIERPTTPGLKYKHYSPKAYLILIEKPMARTAGYLTKIWEKYHQKEKRVGWIHTSGKIELPEEIKQDSRTSVVDLTPAGKLDSREHDSKLVARELFASLRALDNKGSEVIVVEGIGYEKEGLAVMNRLKKAASEII